MRRGQWFSGAGHAPFVDPVDPETLVLGDNHYDVCLPDDAGAHVVLHDAFFIGELDQGTNDAVSIARGPVDGMATEFESELLDPTSTAPVTVRTGERLVVAMDRWAAPDAVLLRNATGTWAVDCLDDGGHAREVTPSDVVSNPDRTLITLSDGSNDLACTALAVRPVGATTATLSSATVIGSGDRVEAGNPRCQDEHIEPDAQTIGLEIPNPAQPQDIIHVELVRQRAWLTEQGLRGGQSWLELPEVGVSGWARVVGIGPAPREEPGRGCLVLMRVSHVASQVLEVRLAGTREAIEVTPPHPLYVEGHGWMPAAAIQPGMELRSDSGPVRVEAIEQASPNQYVYNLEVGLEHAYRVSNAHI